MKLNEKIYACRRRAGLSQEELAERVGVSRQAVSKWETGEAMPEIGKLMSLAGVFGVTTDWLLSENGGTATDSGAAAEASAPPPKKGDLPGILGKLAKKYGYLAGVYIALCGLGAVLVGALALFAFNQMFRTADDLFSSIGGMGNFGGGVVVSIEPDAGVSEGEILDALFPEAGGHTVSPAAGFAPVFRVFAGVILAVGVLTTVFGAALAVWLYKRGRKNS